MSTTTYKFHEEKWPVSKSGHCPVCTKRVTRRTTFTETVNPFNKNANGEPKSLKEVLASLNAKADSWTPDFTHESCTQ